MKRFLIIALLFYLIINISIFANAWSIKNAAKKSSINYSNNPINQNQNLEISFGLHISSDDNSNGTYCPKGLDYNNWRHGIFDYFYSGINIKSDSNQLKSLNINFKIFDLMMFENLHCSRYNFMGSFKLLNFETNNFYDRQINWIDYKHGYGYDFINEIGQQFIPFIYLGIGYNSYKIYENSSSIWSNKFTNFELNAGSSIYLFLNPITLEINSNYSKIMDAPNLDILSFSTELRYSKQELTQYWGLDWGYDYYLRDFAIYLGLDFNKFYVKGETLEFYSLKLGFDYYFKNKIY